MPPDDSRRTNSYIPKRSFVRSTPVRDPSANQAYNSSGANQAAAGIVRNQIDAIYQHEANSQAQLTVAANQPLAATVEPTPEQSARAEAFADNSHTGEDSPYNRTHEDDRTAIKESQWKQYHSAWQDYYQQYYERYYIGEVYRMRQTLDAHTTPSATKSTQQHEITDNLDENDAAFHQLRSDLLQNVRHSATKVRRSRHFMPMVAAGLTVVLFLFLQYNRVIFANVEAYVSPGNIDPANIIVDPNIDIPISQEPRLIIPKINVDVPVVYDTKNDQASQLSAMEKGVAWFGIPGANSKPGQVGNTVLSGHSSNDLFDPGDYKFIFARLEQLQQGDTFYVNYLGTRYVYSITKKEVVLPTDVHKLVYPTDKPVMTLITCVPLGTAQKRLLVTAEQISPDPTGASEAPATDSQPEAEAAMPGNSPSFLNRLFSN